MIKPASALHPLNAHIDQAWVIAYKEQTDRLEHALTQEGFACNVLRQVHHEEFRNYSPSYLALLNHRSAWEQAVRSNLPTLVVEADFVPVIGMGGLRLPFPPDEKQVGIAWLYTCAPQMYSVSHDGYAQGYSSSMVAYIVTPNGAEGLISLADEIRQTIGPTTYSSWDSSIDPFLRKRGFKNFIPFRNYGEHGGRPNLEHQQHGLSQVHRADVLHGRLAFIPPYALRTSSSESKGTVHLDEHMRFFRARSHARLKGLARLASGKYLRLKILRNSSVPTWLLGFAIRRHLSPRL
ncbi:MAG TPA: LPS biosynthesis glycosyltransferase [Elainellaceae cyanobacterium]